MYNENTAKRIDCHLTVRNGRAAVTGDQVIAGVAGQGAAIRLEFHDPGGTRTGRLLSGDPRYDVELHDGRELRPSFVDAANPCVFVDARDLGLTATELPGDIALRSEVLEALEAVRCGTGHVVFHQKILKVEALFSMFRQMKPHAQRIHPFFQRVETG